MGTISAICISEKRGTAKKTVPSVRLIENFGIENDAHAGNWHRQVSLLAGEKIEAFKAKGAVVEDGAFGENLVVWGLDLTALPIGTYLSCQNTVLQVTQIGKECHSHCAIFDAVGQCIMPSNGIFAQVICGGDIKVGDEINICTLQA